MIKVPWHRKKVCGSSDIIDFYGLCDTELLGKDQIEAQKLQAERRWQREHDDEMLLNGVARRVTTPPHEPLSASLQDRNFL
jgi:hypothetical protein